MVVAVGANINFPAQVTATSPLALLKTGGVYAFSVDLSATTIGIDRADIPSTTIAYSKFLTRNLAPWKTGTSAGPMAIQDKAGTWFELDASAMSFVRTDWFDVPKQSPYYEYSGSTAGETSAHLAMRKAFDLAVLYGLDLYPVPGTYFFSEWFGPTIDFAAVPRRDITVHALNCTFVAMTGFPSGNGFLKINRSNVPAQGINRTRVTWRGGFFDASRQPTTAGGGNDCFSISMPYCDVAIYGAEAYAGPKTEFVIASGGTNGSDSGFFVDAEKIVVKDCKATGFPDAGFYLSGGGDEVRIQKSLAMDNIDVVGCNVGVINKRITQDTRITNIRGDTCPIVLATGAADTVQHADSIKAEGYVVSNITGRNCETIIQFQPITRGIVSNIVNVDPGLVVTGKTSTETSTVVLRGAQNCIIDGVLTKGKNPAIAGTLLNHPLNVSQLSANGSVVTQSTDNIVRNIASFDITASVLEGSSSTRNYYEVTAEVNATDASTIQPGSTIFNPFRGNTETSKSRTDTSGTFTFVYGTDQCFQRWADSTTLVGNVDITLSTTIAPPDGATFIIQAPGTLAGYSFKVGTVYLVAGDVGVWKALGGAWQFRGMVNTRTPGHVTFTARAETTGAFTIAYDKRNPFHRWGELVTQTGNIDVTLQASPTPPTGAIIEVQAPGNLGGFTFKVETVSQTAQQISTWFWSGTAWIRKGIVVA